jgi:CBS domain-containing protein
MDGGRVLRAFLWNKRNDIVSSTKSATTVSKFFGYGFIILGFLQMLVVFSFNAFWFILIGMFLNSSAKRAYEQVVYENWLGQFKARDMVGNYGYAIPSHVLVNDAIINYFMPLKRSYFPVIEGPNVVGVVHIKDIKNVPYEARFRTPIGRIMRNVSELPNVKGDATGVDAMKQMRGIEQEPIIVVRREDNDQILGFIGNDEIVSALKFAQMGIHR